MRNSSINHMIVMNGDKVCQMKRSLALVVVLCLLLPCFGNAQMLGSQIIRSVDSRNQSMYAAYDKNSDTFYFWLPGILGFHSFYSYRPTNGWK